MNKTRRSLQLAFLLFTITGVFIIKGNAEQWCPFGGIEAIKTYIAEGNMICALGVSNFYILAGVLIMTLILGRAFCGYICPIGSISEAFGDIAKRSGIPRVKVPYTVDRVLSFLKYAVLIVILYITYKADELLFHGFCPAYALISRHGEDITFWAYFACSGILIGALFIDIPFCRWLCPMAALINPFSRFRVTHIKREKNECINCGNCGKVCPMHIKVDSIERVTDARCLSCMNCLLSCPKKKSGAIVWGSGKISGYKWVQPVLITLMLLCICLPVIASYLSPIPSFVKISGNAPQNTARVSLKIEGLYCRGNANLLVYFLKRDDAYEVPGYLKIEAWPGPEKGEVRITYDSRLTNETAVKEAITEPYYDNVANLWRASPFKIIGYNP